MMPSAAVIVLVVLAVLGFVQVSYWRNTITLFEHTVRISPNSDRAYVNLGAAYILDNRPDLAEPQFRRSLFLNPRGWEAKLRLGEVLIELKRPEEAAALFKELIDADRLDPEYHVMLALAFYNQGKLAEAVFRAQEALRIDPDHERAKTLIDQCRKALRPG